MNVYFFSRHEPHPEMIADLGAITQQFTGTISNIVRNGNVIEFLETPLGQTEAISHSIPGDCIVVAVAPLPLQEAWLKAGATFLVPQNKREKDPNHQFTFKYSGLLRVLKIEVITEQWAGASPSLEDKHRERSA